MFWKGIEIYFSHKIQEIGKTFEWVSSKDKIANINLTKNIGNNFF